LFNKTKTYIIRYPEGKTGDYIIPDGVTGMSYNAFYQCLDLTCVIIPDSVTSIYSGSFSGCTGLSGLYFKGDAPSIGQGGVLNGVDATVYYLPGATGWSTTFGGLPTAVWPTSIADVDVNGDVNFADFAVFAAAWRAVDGVDDAYNPLCDINAPAPDGVINEADLAVFADEWLITPCP